MQPPDPSDAHLADRILEVRVVKSVVVTFLLTLAAVFYGWVPVLAVFAVGYLAYKYRYYANRVGVYASDDLSARRDRLAYALLGFVAVTAGVLVATQVLFPDEWAVGGFLSLPGVGSDPGAQFTVDTVTTDPVETLVWAVVALPVVALSYVGLQFRQRLLVGIDTRAAAVRATLYDGLACLPVAVLWMAAFSARPVYDLWQPVVDQVGIEPSVTLADDTAMVSEFAVVFGDALVPVAGAVTVGPAAIVAAYLAVQRWKYGNRTVPSVLGYRGLLPPSRGFHPLNTVVPAGAYLLYAAAVVTGVGTASVAEPSLLAGAGVAALVATDLRARTTAALRSVPGGVASRVDAVVAGLAVGVLVLAAVAPLVPPGSIVGVALLYPVLAVPLAYAANRVVAYRAAESAASFGERVAADREAFDESTVDRLFLSSEVRDNGLRAAAIDALASAVRADTYRNYEALDVFGAAAGSDDEAVARAGLRGVAGVLGYDRSRATYDRLAAAGVPRDVVASLDRSGETAVPAAEAAARVLTAELELTDADVSQQLAAGHVTQLRDIAGQHRERRQLVDAVVEYTARLYYEATREGVSEQALQPLLGTLLDLTAQSSDRAALVAVLSVTGEPTTADDRRFEQAVDALDSDRPETRYVATHVVRSSMDRHADQVDHERLVALLRDSSDAVRSLGAQTLVTLLQFDPDRGPDLLDALVSHLEEHGDRPGRTEGAVLRALDSIETGAVLDHPTAPSTVAALVDREYPAVSRPAAALLAALVERSPALGRREPVANAVAAGLGHADDAVRQSCLEAVAAIVDTSVATGRQFVGGLGANLGTAGPHGVLAAVTLRQVSNEYPDAALEVVPALADGLDNQTSIDTRTSPFVVRGGTVSAVTVDIIADAVSLDPTRCETLVEPLVGLAPTTDVATRQTIFGALAPLSAEFPETATVAVDVAAGGLQAGRTAIRRDAAQLLANVAAYHPEAVAPTVESLLVATDDSSPRVRTPALIALRNVSAALPGALDSDMHRIVGRLDDDSATVREHAGRLVATVAEREPGIIDPPAETADRLRRLQRDPAVDIDPERLQDASTAIQTGVPAENTETADDADRADIWTPESADEMGVSGETNVFEPVGDEFEGIFDGDAGADDSTDDAVTDRDTVVEGDDGTDDPTTLGEQDTVVRSDESDDGTDERGTGGVDEFDTVIQDDGSDESGGDDETGDTDSDEGGVGEFDTVIRSDEKSDVGDRDTVVGGDDESGESDDDSGG
jgi:hypothetical protein